jgi:hypothetical protein
LPLSSSAIVFLSDEFASGYKRGWYEEKYIVQEFADLFGDTPLAQITTWELEKWKSDKAKTVQQQTVNRCLTVIKHMFKKAVELGMTKIKRHNRRETLYCSFRSGRGSY